MFARQRKISRHFTESQGQNLASAVLCVPYIRSTADLAEVDPEPGLITWRITKKRRESARDRETDRESETETETETALTPGRERVRERERERGRERQKKRDRVRQRRSSQPDE